MKEIYKPLYFLKKKPETHPEKALNLRKRANMKIGK